MQSRRPYLANLAFAAFAGVILAIIGIGLARHAHQASAAGTVVTLKPAHTNVKSGETVDINVFATNLDDLGAYEFTIQYNQSVLKFVSFDDAGFLGSTGRTPTCLPGQVNDDQHTVLGGCATFGFDGRAGGTAPAGPSGDATLATFHFQAIADGASDLIFRKLELALPSGDDCCVIDSVGETAVAVGQAVSGNPTPPPTPQPDRVRLTPTVPAGERADQLRLDPAAAAVPSGSMDSTGAVSGASSGVITGESPDGSALPAGSSTGAGADAAGANFPRAGYGPGQTGHPWGLWETAIAAALALGFLSAGMGLARRTAGS